MKAYIASIVIGAASQFAYSQADPQAYLLNSPAPPGKGAICTYTSEQKSDFRQKVAAYDSLVEERIDELRKDEEKDVKAMEEDAKKKVMSDYGLSPADMQKLQSGQKMTKEEQQALANKMLQQNYNMSLDEIQKVSKMSQSGKEAWGEALASEKMAEAEANPQQAQQTISKNKSLVEVTQEKDELNKKITAAENAIGEKFSEIEKDIRRMQMDREIDSLRGEYMNLAGAYSASQAQKMDMLKGKILSLQSAYCGQFASRYLDVLAEEFESVRKLMPDYYRLEELINEVNRLTIGTQVNALKKGVVPFQAVQGYLGHLAGVFKYAKFSMDENFMAPAKE